MRNGTKLGLLGLFVMVAVVVGCDDDDMFESSDAPETHTVSLDGVRHLEGLRDPLDNCTACHGADLRGGDDGEPSCFSCHGQKWP